MNLEKIEELNKDIAYHLSETLLALEGTNSEYKNMVADKYLVTLEMLREGIDAIRHTVLKDLEGIDDGL